MAEIGAIAAVVSAVGTGISAIGAYSAAQFQADQADRNARAVMAANRVEEERLRRDRTRRMGAIRAAYGAAGVQNTGTPLEVLGDQAMEAELDALSTRYNGASQAANLRSSASSYRSGATGSLISGGFGVGSSLLNSAAIGSFGPVGRKQSSDIWI